MTAISDKLVDNLVVVYFFYGLAFFVLGVTLAMAIRRDSPFKFATLLLPFALFGLLHGVHEWFEMFQLIHSANAGYVAPLWHEVLRVMLLALSFFTLLLFGLLLLFPRDRRRAYYVAGALSLMWLVSILLAARLWEMNANQLIAASDVLARYILAIPAALLAAWALMTQQRVFRSSGVEVFGASMVWAATALIVYGLVGQVFVRETVLPVAPYFTSASFLINVGIPVQLFRAVLAVILTVSMLRVLGALTAEEKRRFQESNEARIAAQEASLKSIQRSSQRLETVNQELQLATYKLSLMVDISNSLQDSRVWPSPLTETLHKIIETLSFARAGMILLAERDEKGSWIASALGYEQESTPEIDNSPPELDESKALGDECLCDGTALCVHADGKRMSFTLEEALVKQECRQYLSPTLLVALPLKSGDMTIGCLVLANDPQNLSALSYADLSLMVGIAQELGLSVENALLHQQALEREKVLAELLSNNVAAQEGERQRIARELHDATGQSLTAIALGLKGIETQIRHKYGDDNTVSLLSQLDELQAFSTDALKELSQIISDLRPPHLDELGLSAAIGWYCKEFGQRWNIETELSVVGDDSSLSDEYKTLLFRITQEALINIAKHADANTARVKLIIGDRELQLTIQDDGKGFEPAQTSAVEGAVSKWGLIGMRERASLAGGSLDIDSSPETGTIITVTIPFIPMHDSSVPDTVAEVR